MQTELDEKDNSAVTHSGETTIEIYNVFCYYSNLLLAQKLFDFLNHSSVASENTCDIEQFAALFGYHIFDFFVLPKDVPMKQVSRSKIKQSNSLEFEESKISKDDLVEFTNKIAYRFSKDLLAVQHPEADPLEEVIQKSLLFIESKKQESNIFLSVVEKEDLFRTRLVHFLFRFNLLHEGVLSMPTLDLFILHYIRFSFKTEILEKSLILPDDEKGIHFLEKSCIPLPEMDFQIALPIISLKHQYYCYIFEKYPMIISLCSYFPEAPVSSFQRYNSHLCRTSQAEKDIVIKLLVANIIDEAQRLFDEMSRYDQNIFLIDDVEIASLRDLEVLSYSIVKIIKLLKIFELKDKEAQNLEFSSNLELFDITKGQSTVITVSPYTLNMVTKDPKWSLRASLINRVTCEISEVPYNFEQTSQYLQLFFCDIKNLSELKKWYFMQKDEFFKKISSDIIAPLETEAFVVLHWMAHIISSWNFPKNLFIENREDVVLLLAQFLLINRVKSVKNSLDPFLLSILEKRITELQCYGLLSADWINSSCALFNRSYLRAHLSAIIITVSCFQLRIIDLCFVNSCLASHAAYMETVSEEISPRKLRNIANQAFLAAIPQDTLTCPEKYFASISSFINHAST